VAHPRRLTRLTLRSRLCPARVAGCVPPRRLSVRANVHCVLAVAPNSTGNRCQKTSVSHFGRTATTFEGPHSFELGCRLIRADDHLSALAQRDLPLHLASPPFDRPHHAAPPCCLSEFRSTLRWHGPAEAYTRHDEEGARCGLSNRDVAGKIARLSPRGSEGPAELSGPTVCIRPGGVTMRSTRSVKLPVHLFAFGLPASHASRRHDWAGRAFPPPSSPLHRVTSPIDRVTSPIRRGATFGSSGDKRAWRLTLNIGDDEYKSGALACVYDASRSWSFCSSTFCLDVLREDPTSTPRSIDRRITSQSWLPLRFPRSNGRRWWRRLAAVRIPPSHP